MPKPTTNSTVALEESGPFHLGDVVHLVWTTDAVGGVSGLVTVQVATGGFSQYVANSGDAVTLGPTPTWMTDQPGTLSVELLQWVDAHGKAGWDTLAIGPSYEVI